MDALNSIHLRPASSRRTPPAPVLEQKSEVAIIPADVNDARTLHGIETRSFPEPWSLREFEQCLLDPGMLTSIAMSGGTAVGYVILNAWNNNVDSMAVVPEARGQKLGQKLMVHALEQAREKGADQCTLQVECTNEPAKHLYHKLGFEVAGRLPGYYYGRDGQVMVLDDLQATSTTAHLDSISGG